MTRILVADDSQPVRHGLCGLLKQHNDWEICAEAVDGREAVDKFRQLAPDVVVLDFSMPVMNGIEAAREILNIRPTVAIVLCSMYLDTQLTSVADSIGVTSVLSKSNVGRVIKAVEAALCGKSYRETRI